MKSLNKKKGLSVVLIVTLLFLLIPLNGVYAKSQTSFSFKLGIKPRGEYNITLSGAKFYSKPGIYTKDLFGKYKKVTSGVNVIKKDYGYKIKFSAEKKTYYLRGKTDVTPIFSCKANTDRYSTKAEICTSGISWTPNEKSKQPYVTTISGMRTEQIAYLTREEAAIYAIGLTENLYLKILDTSVQISVIIAEAGILPESALAHFLETVERNSLIKAALTIVAGVGGIQLIPSLKSSTVKSIEKATKNYSTGLKVVILWTQNGGYTDSYESWNQKKCTIKGQKYCRGKFKKFDKLYGWY